MYINECNNVTFEAYQELAVRTKKEVYLDWNPTHEFWFDEQLKHDDDVDFLIVTYLDNEACPQNAVDYILKAKEKAANSPYWENWYNVYGLGKLGQLQGAIFKDWELGEFDDSLPYCYGLDFGFSPDPSVMLKVACNSKTNTIYIKEEFYLLELSTDEIIDVIKSRLQSEFDVIVADGSEKRLINHIRRSNVNVIKANRDAGSVKAGYKGLMGWKIVVCGEDVKNIEYAFNHHLWNDKKAGIPMNVHKHIPDCMRYAFEFLIMRKGL